MQFPGWALDYAFVSLAYASLELRLYMSTLRQNYHQDSKLGPSYPLKAAPDRYRTIESFHLATTETLGAVAAVSMAVTEASVMTVTVRTTPHTEEEILK